MASPQLDEERIFNTARRIPNKEARADYLEQICVGDLALRERVEALLAASEQDQEFLKSAEGRTAETIELGSAVERPGATIGRYKLMELIAEGGMGSVFVAQQDRPLRRKVALKVIKPGMDSKSVIARFEAERNALALMNHPNIAKVLDAGTTDRGHPYFVMELIQGKPITEYCDQKKLTIKQRLELFIDICNAIQHAHQKGVIHRDLKPTNILVTEIDGRPVPKVIDFGVAKALGANLTDRTVYTSFQSLVGTPLYMSPEQAQLSGVDVDTSSDVYSLGILLYELLTGTTPLNAEELKQAAQDEVLRRIRETDPPRPSNRISSLNETSTEVSECRSAQPDQLGRLVRGDLDWIVMKALEKDRNRRYKTADGLSADVVRHLTDEPVEARPPSAGYRLSRLCRRNKVLSTAIAICFFVLAFAVAGTTLAWRTAIREKEYSEDTRRQLTERNSELIRTEQRLDETLVKLTDSLFDNGMMLAFAGDYSQAGNYLELLEETDAVEQRVLLKAFLDLAQNRYPEAIEALELIAQEKSDSVAIRALLTICYDAAGQPVDWFRSHLALKDLTPTTAEDFLLATFATYTLDPARAMEWSEKALELRRSPMAYLVRARATAENAMHSGKIDDLERALQ